MNVYETPFVSPVTTSGLPDPVFVAFPGDAVTLYDVIATPPSDAGGEKLTVVLIPPGSFRMGSPGEEPARNGWETGFDAEASHRVTLTRPFYLGKFEVTQGQYEAVLGKDRNRSFFSPTAGGADKVKGMRTDRLPVEMVSWDEAAEFCTGISKLVGMKLADRPENYSAVPQNGEANGNGRQSVFPREASRRQAELAGVN